MCTANVVEMIPNPLLDRMEVIAIAGYITDEKIHIARDYLEKSTREACGIKLEQVVILTVYGGVHFAFFFFVFPQCVIIHTNYSQVEVTDAALLALIENYCRESGVRNLQKQIEKIYRKVCLLILDTDLKFLVCDNVIVQPRCSTLKFKYVSVLLSYARELTNRIHWFSKSIEWLNVSGLLNKNFYCGLTDSSETC